MLIDNKKTREISWNDFELEGNKENLIKEGWESFEPYGFGEFIEKAPEEVFEDGYTNNLWANGKPKETTYYRLRDAGDSELYIDDDSLCVDYVGNTASSAPRIRYTFLDGFNLDGDYTLSFYIKSSSEFINFVDIRGAGVSYSFYTKKEWTKQTFKFSGNGEISAIYFGVSNIDLSNNLCIKNIKLEKGFNDNPTFTQHWQDLPEEEKPVNAYVKGYTYIQPLDNGFTRVRTKGGDTDMKLKSPNFGQLAETGTDMTISLYVENNSDSMIRFSNNLAIGGVPYPDGAEYMITVPREYKGFAYLKGEQVGRDVELDIRSDGNIDMIVSQPEIIEGHDLNAMLLIEDLDDGRKHVQVHNVNENTKLVYTGDNVIKGEPYTLETEIENDGRIFNLSANMFDSVVEVQKGMNDIRKSGELQDKELKIEIGVD